MQTEAGRKIAILFLGLFALVARAEAPKATLASDKIIVNFMGKGIAFWWDLGVSKGLQEWLKTQPKKDLYFAGNSSGSFFAAYFACWGLSEETAEEGIRDIAALVRPEYLGKHPAVKFAKIVAGVSTEQDISPMRAAVNRVIYRDGKRCDELKHPVVIPAMNGVILDDRIWKEKKPLFGLGKVKKDEATKSPDLYSGKEAKSFDWETFLVKDTATGAVLGKACTYFVSESMAEILSRIPNREPLCDLYVMKTAEDVAAAIYATISEPSFFHPFDEKIFTDLLHQDCEENGKPGICEISEMRMPFEKKQSYIGGFGLPVAGLDVKRAFPDAFSLGSSMSNGVHREGDQMVKRWYLVSVNESLRKSKEAGLDMEIHSPSLSNGWYLEKEKFEAAFREAYAVTKGCLAAPEKCKPVYLEAPSILDALPKQKEEK